MIAAIVRGGVVENTVYVDSLSALDDPAWTDALDGASVVEVDDGEAVGPGYTYDDQAEPRFEAPPDPPAPGPTPADVLVQLGAIAADGGLSMEQKLAAIIGVLAESAPAD